MPNLLDVMIPLTEIEVAALVKVGGLFARRLACQRDRLQAEVRQLQAEVRQLQADNAALAKRWAKKIRGR